MATPPVKRASAPNTTSRRAGIEQFLFVRVLAGVLGDPFKV